MGDYVWVMVKDANILRLVKHNLLHINVKYDAMRRAKEYIGSQSV